ncbi:MAG TPA: hypothetical protein PKB11_15645 [Desulfovibrio sp.]|jgi:hypothetical protein|uniref:hypothetical protein n=1 Tax=Desulfovibrio sp. TaxID=885 RepID=UPI002C46C03C|nr:hypothetical protein [Desulfovibrio sp.]HMM40190.1 hypothetical protein [Desulfovibrio sp.]
MRAVLTTFVLFLILGMADAGFAASAWKAKEQECIARCPQFPRFGGREDQKAWTERIRKQREYDSCYIGCVKGQMSAWRRPLGPPKDGSQAYFKRNAF